MKSLRRPLEGRKGRGWGYPTAEQCVYHRCARHEKVPALNHTEEVTHSECGACVAEAMLTREAQLFLVLDGYGERLAYSHRLKELLTGARERLNILQPGAGDYLDEFEAEEES